VTRALLGLALVIGVGTPVLADGERAPRQRNPVDRGDIVIRSPDNSDVPADLTPRQPRDIQIMVDPYGRRRDIDERRRPRFDDLR
jgi:hypothetical protein